jgi:hypothetical protein
VPVRPELNIFSERCSATQSGNVRQQRWGVQHLDVVPVAQHARQHLAGLRQVRRAGHVADHAARTRGVDRRGQQPALQPGQLGHLAW